MRKALIITLGAAIAIAAIGARPSKSATDLLESARQYAREYRPAEAREQYDAYEKQLRRSKKAVSDEIEAERTALITMENMLERVEAIVVFDSLTVDSADFFLNYRMTPEAGRIVKGVTARIEDAPMAFIPQSNTELLYSLPDSTGNYVLMGADILDDGTIDHPAPLGADAGGGSALFPFLMSDGVTLYYAHNGEGSLGGYDIFMTRRTDSGDFLQPQNVGMPYNSPANDYLLAIDETAGIGWWATDRNALEGQVTIYLFRPSATRVNVSPDAIDLRERARLSDISLTWEPDADYTALREKAHTAGQATKSAVSNEPSFEIAVGNRIFSSLSDFTSTQARSAMARAINARAAVTAIEDKLSALRERYRKGDRSTETNILNLEQQLNDERINYREAVNDAITHEIGAE